MRHNGRPALLASEMRPEHLSLRDGEPRLAVCPDCLTWHRLQRSMIRPHRAPDAVRNTQPRRYYGDKPSGGRRCPGSAQRITIDITPEQWGERLLAADSTATGRRSTRVTRKPRTAPAPAIAHIAAQKQAAEEPGDGRAPWLLREMKWASTAPAVREADIRRAQLPAGDAPLDSPPVPTTTLRPKRPAC